MDRTKDYYSVLGVLPTAEPVVIRAAYRALAMKYHPDKWIGDRSTAERRMREINEAYEVLSTDQARKQYDGVRQKDVFEEDEFDTDATQDAFQDAEQAQQPDWEIALEYYPDLDAIYSDLRRTSVKLAFAFRAMLLETKLFSERNKLARQLEANFLQVYFGRNERIVDFARKLIEGGHKSAARELNRAVSVLGPNPDESLIIGRIQKKLFNEQKEAADRKLIQQMAARVALTGYVDDAVALVRKLNGTIMTETKGGLLFEKDYLIVTVLGERGHFKNYYEMAQWVIRTIVPKIPKS